ncbi:MAG: AraC family transcriptional regulator [Alistipes sp.]|nr:AraC family transcriptional regulator [Alistipes sp.]
MQQDKKDIRSFTLEELVSRHSGESDIVYYDGCLVGRSSPDDGAELLRYPIRIDAHIICLCRNSGGEMISNLARYDIKRNGLVALAPESVICVDERELNRREQTDITLFAFEPDFLHKLNIDMKQVIPLMSRWRERQAYIELSDREMILLEREFEAIREAVTSLRDSRFYHEIVRRTIESTLYTIMDVALRRIETREQFSPVTRSRNEEYFRRFTQCLYENYKSERSVGFYASQLHITPKYLTTVVKNVSGRSAMEWIDEYVILEAKNLLKYSSMSIQEVAYALNFPNQSFFGKYFKHRTSMSPSAYKMRR